MKHTHESVVGVPSLIDHIKTKRSETGYKCFDDGCRGLLWPDEIELAFEHELIRPGITEERRTTLAEYKRRFYASYAPAAGGRRVRKTHKRRRGGRKGTRRGRGRK